MTSDFHMPRTRVLFEDMYSLASRDVFGEAQRCVGRWGKYFCPLSRCLPEAG